MKTYADPHALETPLQRGEGYLVFMAYLQIVAGALTALFSLLAIVKAVSVDASVMLNPLMAIDYFGGRQTGTFASLVAGYMVFQMVFGWIMGLLLIVAGVCCLKRRAKGLVRFAAVVNLLNIPHGTTVAIMMLHGLSRPGIAGAFRRGA